jgi:hypothetical protein
MYDFYLRTRPGEMKGEVSGVALHSPDDHWEDAVGDHRDAYSGHAGNLSEGDLAREWILRLEHTMSSR